MSDGVTLAISASARRFSVALRSAAGIVCEQPERGNASDLAVTVAELFAAQELTPDQLTEIRVDVGPGSYTGLRVALTFARVAAAFHQVPIHVATSLELIALAAIGEGDAVVRPVLDARRERFHHAAVRMADGCVELIDEPKATSFGELRGAIGDGEVIIAEEALHALFADAGVEVREPVAWDARLLFDERVQLREAKPAEIEPLYLMGSYAET